MQSAYFRINVLGAETVHVLIHTFFICFVFPKDATSEYFWSQQMSLKACELENRI